MSLGVRPLTRDGHELPIKKTTQEAEMIRKALIVMAWVFISMPATAEEWDISVWDDMVIASITGDITYGDRQRFVFRKENCQRVNHVFSTHTMQPANFKNLNDAILAIEFNGEFIGAKLIFSKKAMLGH